MNFSRRKSKNSEFVINGRRVYYSNINQIRPSVYKPLIGEKKGSNFISYISSLYINCKTAFLNILLVIVSVLIVADVYSNIIDNSIKIEPFEVCEKVQKSGASGRVVANILTDNIHNIIKISRYGKSLPFVLNTNQESYKAEIPGMGISSAVITEKVRSYLGVENIRITGEVYSKGDIYYITARVNEDHCVTRVIDINNIDPSIHVVAQKLIEYTQPILLFRYQAKRASDSGECIDCLNTLKIALSNKSKDDDTDAYLGWGWLLIRDGKYRQAISKYRFASTINPNNPDVYTNWGTALYYIDKYRAADSMYKKAESLDLKRADLYSNWSTILNELGKHDEAIEKARTALSIDSVNEDAYGSWANALYYKSKYAEALDKYVTTIERYPQSITRYGDVTIDLLKHFMGLDDYNKVSSRASRVIGAASGDLKRSKWIADAYKLKEEAEAKLAVKKL
jgi:tetratricopeptide (TPR) repeat protein